MNESQQSNKTPETNPPPEWTGTIHIYHTGKPDPPSGEKNKSDKNFCFGLTRYEFVSALVQVGILIATATSACIAYWQWDSLNETLLINSRAVDITKSSADTAERALELSERAWMNVSHVQMKSDLAPDVPVTVGITLKNVGKTPAQTITANLAVGPHPKCECAPLGKIEDLGSVGPGAEATVKGNMNPHPLATIEAVRRGSLTIGFCGEILYEDEFSKVRRTTFNMFYTPNEEKKFSMCSMGNFME